MIKNTQWQVATFMKVHVPKEIKSNFLEHMKKFNGSNSVQYAFYNFDILLSKLNEVKNNWWEKNNA